MLKNYIVCTLLIAGMIMSCCLTSSEAADLSKLEDTNELIVYIGGDENVKFLWQNDLLPAFAKKYPEIKYKIVHFSHSTGLRENIDKLIAQEKTGKTKYDFDLTDGFGAVEYRKGGTTGVLLPATNEYFSNLDKCNPLGLQLGLGYGIPYRGSSVVLAFDSARLPAEQVPNTMDELFIWIINNHGKFTYNEPGTGGSGESFVNTALFKFSDYDGYFKDAEYHPELEEEWAPGFLLLKALEPYLYQQGVYPKGNAGTLDLLNRGEILLTPAWSDMAMSWRDEGRLPPTLKLKQLNNPPFTGGSAYLTVTSKAPNLKNAILFIDWMLTPEAQDIVIKKMKGYPGIKWEFMPEGTIETFGDVASGYRRSFSEDYNSSMKKNGKSLLLKDELRNRNHIIRE